jgi:hypothetical protein
MKFATVLESRGSIYHVLGKKDENYAVLKLIIPSHNIMFDKRTSDPPVKIGDEDLCLEVLYNTLHLCAFQEPL